MEEKMSKYYATEERQFTEFMAELPEPTQFMKDFKWGGILQGRQYRNYKNDYCDVRIWEKSQNVIVLFSQDDANPSMSITNASEYIATAVKKFVPQARKVRWFESYECYIINGEHHFDEIFYDLDSQGMFCHPKWRRKTKQEFGKIVN